MNEHELRSGQSVHRPYTRVKDILANDTLGLIQRATTSGALGGANKKALHMDLPDATLSVTVAGHDVHRDIHIEITSFDTSGRPPSALLLPGFAVAFKWRAASARSLFPTLRAALTVYPLASDVTQLDLHSWYTPPVGAIGAIADAFNHHRIAEASVTRFLDDIVRRLAIDAA